MTGDTLSNDAVELLRRTTGDPAVNVVLAVYGSNFVTWIERGEQYSFGGYFRDLNMAIEHFNER